LFAAIANTNKDYDVNDIVRTVSNGRKKHLHIGMASPFLWRRENDYGPTSNGSTEDVLAFFGACV
jgi:hypothetical protein